MSEAHDTELEPDDLPLDGEAGGDQDDAPKSVEDKASAMGWTPKERFKGDLDRWVDAETFVKRGEELMPILQANNRRMEKALETERKERGKLEKTLADFSKHHSETAAREYARAQKDIEARLDAAAAIGDVAGVRDATQEIVDLAKEAKTAPAGEAPAKLPELDTWRAANPWYGTDDALTAAVDAIGQKAFDEGYRGAAQVKEVASRVKEKFPHLYTNPNRERAPSVEGGGQSARKTGKSYSDLPPDAKAACDDFVKRIPGFTRDQYTKDFFAS